jgi:hypothetical protein
VGKNSAAATVSSDEEGGFMRQTAKDIQYMRKSLVPARSMTEAAASDRMKKLVQQAVTTRTTQINDAVHLFVHQSKSAKIEAKEAKKKVQ